jgi:phage-related protein (TIGR01555 family)
MPKTRKRKNANDLEKSLGVRGTTSSMAQDFFSNAGARMGFGTPSLGQGADYTLERLSYNYWLLVTLYRNHWISRRIVDVPAQDMVKAWPRLTSDLEPKDLTKLDRALRLTNTKNQVLTGLTWGRLYGGAGALIVIEGQEDELDQPLDLESIEIGSYKGLIPFDRWSGISPLGDVCVDINRPLDFNKPELYEVRSAGAEAFKVHSSRLLRFLGPTVPTPELEAQSYWGISVLEPAYESITKLDNMSWNILSLTFRANLLGMEFPELSQITSGVGMPQQAAQRMEQRLSAMNHMMSNNSLIPLPKDGEIKSTQYSFGGLAEVFQLFQLDLSGASQIPVARLWGRTYNGLGQTGDGDERVYEEKIAADQATFMTPQLEKLYPVICMSELGEVPDDVDLVCPSLRVLDEKEKSELAKSVADTITVYLNGGIMTPRTAAREVKQSSDLTGIGTNITDEDIEKLADKVQAEGEMGEGLFGGEGGGLDPADSPAKAMKLENKAGKEDDDDDEPPTKKGDVKPVGKNKKKEPEPKPKDKKKAKDAISQRQFPSPYNGYEILFRHTFKVYVKGGYARGEKPLAEFASEAKAKAYIDNGARATDSDGEATPHDGMQLFHGLPVMVETPAGGNRSGITPDGAAWSINMPADYGFIMNVPGADGDSIDCYVGPSPESNNVFVVDQTTLDGSKFDEHKVCLGYHTAESAKEDYMSGHHKSGDIFAGITEFTMPLFRRWLASADLTKPCSAGVEPSLRRARLHAALDAKLNEL